MAKYIKILSVMIISTLVIVACGAEPEVAEAPAVEAQPGAMAPKEESQSAEANNTENTETQPESMYPAWYTESLTDVNTGAVFTVEQNLGKVILVETLATWCSNCYRQQLEVQAFHDKLGERDDFVSLGINIDPNEDVPLLTEYVRKNGFDWLYVVASDAMIDEISALYGPQFLNPPSTPMLIIDRDGNPHPLGFGIKSADELLEAVTPYL